MALLGRPYATGYALIGGAAVTFCSWHPVITMVRRGPVRGPSHPCKLCNQGHRRRGFVVSVQLASPERRAMQLIIRRSRVRAPPVPPRRCPVQAPLTCDYAVFKSALSRAGYAVMCDPKRQYATRCSKYVANQPVLSAFAVTPSAQHDAVQRLAGAGPGWQGYPSTGDVAGPWGRASSRRFSVLRC